MCDTAKRWLKISVSVTEELDSLPSLTSTPTCTVKGTLTVNVALGAGATKKTCCAEVTVTTAARPTKEAMVDLMTVLMRD